MWFDIAFNIWTLFDRGVNICILYNGIKEVSISKLSWVQLQNHDSSKSWKKREIHQVVCISKTKEKIHLNKNMSEPIRHGCDDFSIGWDYW